MLRSRSPAIDRGLGSMATETVVIQSVSIENFRGFRATQEIDLGASAVIVSGSNGKGKTSFFDALQWLLIGSVGRLEKLAGRRSGGFIVNRFAGPGASATVRMQIDSDGRATVITRRGDHKSTTLEWRSEDSHMTGAAAEEALNTALLGPRGPSLKDAVLTSGILEQDVVRAVLEDEPKNRYRHMADLLGLQDIMSFEDDSKRQAEELDREAKAARSEHADAEQSLRKEEAELERLEQRFATQPEIAQARADLLEEISKTANSFAIESLPLQTIDAVALAQTARRLRAASNNLLSEGVALQVRESSAVVPDAARLSAIRLEEQQALGERAQAQSVLDDLRLRRQRAAEFVVQLAELAERALPLLSDQCPVCGQAIDTHSVETHLRELLNIAGDSASPAESSLLEAERSLSVSIERLNGIQAEEREIEGVVKQSEDLRTARSAWRTAVANLASDEFSLRTSVREGLRQGHGDTLSDLRYSADRLSAIADRLVALLGSAGLGEEIERQRAAVRAAQERVGALSELATRASQQAEGAKTLAGAATRAIAQVMADRFAKLQPLVDQIFARLAPHPAFTALGFEMGVAYRSGIADPFAKDPESGVSGDPLLLFSSSQANVAALTYFLAMSWAGGTKALPFLLLDDPLQSMDDVNVLGFSDLCRHIRGRRQLIVSTHEDRLANLLARKLTPRSPEGRTRVLRFVGWDRDGPKVEQSDVETEVAGFLLRAG